MKKYIIFFNGLLNNQKQETRFQLETDRQTAKSIYRHFDKNSIYIIESGIFEKETRIDISGMYNYI